LWATVYINSGFFGIIVFYCLIHLPIVIGTLLPGEKGSKKLKTGVLSPSPLGEGFRVRPLAPKMGLIIGKVIDSANKLL
jgi:hypothetical protein